MKIVLFAAALFTAFLSAAPAAESEAQTVPLHGEPRSLPTIAFFDGDNQLRSLADWRGKIILLNVWATWCVPCRVEMPTLDRLQARLGGEDFEVVALSIDRAGVGVVAKFFQKIGIGHLRIFIDDSGKAARDLKVFGLPATLLIGRDGLELGRLIGPAKWDTPEMIALIEAVVSN